MKKNLRENSLQPLFIATSVVVGSLGSATTAISQDFTDLHTPKSPLVLKAQGSFFVGGEIITTDGLLGEPSGFGLPASGKMTVNQMYVRYMIPAGKVKAPVVMVHGGTLTGKSYETTPDGRMGWDEYFVRRGHAVFVPDQVARGRSGFNQSSINIVRSGNAPPSTLPNIVRVDTDTAWETFDWGTGPGQPFPGVQFPVEAADEFAKQGVPDFFGLPTSEFTIKALSELAEKSKGAVLMGHSQSSHFPREAALINPAAVKATVVIDACPGGFGAGAVSDAELARLKDVPMLGVLGARNNPAACTDFINRFAAVGGKAQAIFPPDLGIQGNTHMMMLDKNNLQIADLILKWLDKNVKFKKKGGRDDDDDHHHHY